MFLRRHDHNTFINPATERVQLKYLNTRVPLEHIRLATMAALIAVLLAVAAGCGTSSSTQNLPATQVIQQEYAITNDWLTSQPGLKTGSFSIHLLDANQSVLPVPDWMTADFDPSSGNLDLRFAPDAADDLYVYITYAGDEFSFAGEKLTAAVNDQYLSLVVCDQGECIVTCGFSRIAEYRGQPSEHGLELNLEFNPEPEQRTRSTSAVNQAARSVVELSITETGSDWARLEWDERNIGDYNNNGLIEIADITPVGQNYEVSVHDAPNPAELIVVDGNLDGYITVSDLTAIGQNWACKIQGYNVYYCQEESQDPADFTLIADSTVTRESVWDATSDDGRKRRLHYSFDAGVEDDWNGFLVKAYAVDADVTTVGPASNIVSHTPAGNQPPYWASTSGLTNAYGIGEGAVVDFGNAIDPEGGDITYIVSCVTGPGPIDETATEVELPAEATEADAPYRWFLAGLSEGEQYTLMIQGADPEGLRTNPTAGITVTIDRLLDTGETWGCFRADPARTGCNPESQIAFPLEEKFSSEIDFQVNSDQFDHPVISKDGQLVVCIENGFRTFDVVSGTDGLTVTGFTNLVTPYPAVSDNVVAVNSNSGLFISDISGTQPYYLYSTYGTVKSAPLVLGDFIYIADTAGIITCISAISHEAVWEFAAAPSAEYSMSLTADDNYLYACRDDGRIDKLDLRTGESIANCVYEGDFRGESMALDSANNRLYFVEAGFRLVAMNTDYLVVEESWPVEGTEAAQNVSPALALHHDPPLAITAISSKGYSGTTRLVAINLDDGSEYWTNVGYGSSPAYISVGHDCVYLVEDYYIVGEGNVCVALHGLETGELLQQYMLADDYNSEAVLDQDRLAVLYETSSDDMLIAGLGSYQLEPPYWINAEDGEIGISNLSPGTPRDEITYYDADFRWFRAAHVDDLIVKYVLFYAENHPPMMEPPYTDTTVVPGFLIQDNDDGTVISDLTPDVPCYAGMRAYVGNWGVDAVSDDNTNILYCTTPWDRRYLTFSYNKCPDEIGTMFAAIDETDHHWMAVSDAADGGIWIYRDNDNLTSEWTTPFKFDFGAFSFKDNTPYFAICKPDVNQNIRVIDRYATDSYNPVWVTGTTLDGTGTLDFDVATEQHLAYTEHVGGTAPTSDVHYYCAQTSSGTWQAPVVLDDTNQGGRDISIVADPTDGTKMYAAYQLGTEKGTSLPLATRGELWIAHGDITNGFTKELVDAGDNSPASDCGKRVKLSCDADGHLHLVYLDLNASTIEPRGQLKYAYHDGSGWNIEVIRTFTVGDATGDYAHVYNHIGLDFKSNGHPVIAFPERREFYAGDENADIYDCYAISKDTDGDWVSVQLADGDSVDFDDRGPCYALVGYSWSIEKCYVTYMGHSFENNPYLNDRGVRWFESWATWPRE